MEMHTSGEHVELQGTDKRIFLVNSTIEVEILFHSTGGEREVVNVGGEGGVD